MHKILISMLLVIGLYWGGLAYLEAGKTLYEEYQFNKMYSITRDCSMSYNQGYCAFTIKKK